MKKKKFLKPPQKIGKRTAIYNEAARSRSIARLVRRAAHKEKALSGGGEYLGNRRAGITKREKMMCVRGNVKRARCTLADTYLCAIGEDQPAAIGAARM